MSRITEPRMDRRRFVGAVGMGLKAATAFAAFPAASALFAGCSEQPAPPAAPTGAGAAKPARAKTPAAAEAPAAPASGAGSELVTELAAMSATVQALQYVDQSTKPDQRCANCQLFTAQGDGTGRCQLFTQGLVREGGWCMSWVARQPASPS